MSKQKVTKSTESTTALMHVITPAELNITEDARKDVSPVSMAVYVRTLLQNWRQGTVACKGRADVAYSNKKPWKQKGTGRARAGSARSPLWRGGGVIFGPQARTRVLKTSTQVKRNVLNSILFKFLEQSKIVALDWNSSMQKPKTALAYKLLKDSNLHDEKVVLFLPTHDQMSYASFINIPNVQILFFDQPNAYDLVNGTRWVVLKKDLEQFKQMVSQWI
jgi:large subunit ribosomal protein L4